MTKATLILVMLLSSPHVFAKMECYQLLTNPSRGYPGADEVQLDYASTWMHIYGGSLNAPNQPQWSQLNILERWQSWRNLTRTQRERALTLELLKLSPPLAQTTVELFDAKALKALSEANLARMIGRLDELFPVREGLEDRAGRIANTMVARLRFTYTRPVNPYQYANAPLGYDAPIPSSRELQALGLEPTPSYYSQLVGTTPSVEFNFFVSKQQSGSPASWLRREVFVLADSFAKDTGFVLPRFHSMIDLFNFFDFWNPEASERTFRANWMSLPYGVRTYENFREHLNTVEADELFASENAYTQMAPMRTALRGFVLTPNDAEKFLKLAFRRYVLSVASRDIEEAQALNQKLSTTPAINRFFTDEFMELLHFPFGLGLRIPIAVSAAHYVLSRLDDTPYNSRMPLRPPSILNPSAIDQSKKP